MIDKVLELLMFNKKINAAKLSKETGVPTQTIGTILLGKSKKPHMKTLVALSNFFEVNIEQLKGNEPLPSELSHISIGSNNIHPSNIPILEWDNISMDTLNNLKEIKELTYGPGSLSSNAFATYLSSDAMEPYFNNGDVLIFDPNVKYTNTNYVLAYIAKNKAFMFRQYINTEQEYLKSLSFDTEMYPSILLNHNDIIIATLVESRKNFNISWE